MRRIAFSGLALALTLGSGSFLAAQQPSQPQAPATQQQHARRGHWRLARRNPGRMLFRGVQLTQQEKAQIKAINRKYRTELQKDRQALRPAMQEARADRQKGDQAAARAVFQRNQAQFQQMRAQRDQEMKDIRAVLTPDQQKQLDQNVARLRARAQQWQTRRQQHQEQKGS